MIRNLSLRQLSTLTSLTRHELKKNPKNNFVPILSVLCSICTLDSSGHSKLDFWPHVCFTCVTKSPTSNVRQNLEIVNRQLLNYLSQ